MTKFVSRRGTLGIAVEATRFTAVNPTYWIPWAVMSFQDMIEGAREDQALGNIADSDSFYVTFKKGEGTIDSQLYDIGLGFILTSLLGASPVTTGSGTYTHTYTLSQTNQPKTLSLYWTDPDRSYMFAGATVDSLSIKVAANSIVSYTIGFKSKAAADWTAQTPDFTTLGNKFLQQDFEFSVAATVGALGTETAIKEFELNINRNTIYDNELGTSNVTDILAQDLSIEGNFNLNLTDDTFRDYMLDGTYRAMQVFLNASSTSSLKLQLPRVDFNEWQHDYNLKEIAKQTVNFKANYDATNALQIISTCVLVNTDDGSNY